MASRAAAGVATSHVPAIGAAVGHGGTREPYREPYRTPLFRSRTERGHG